MAPNNITFNCPGCGRVFNIEARLKGRKVRCSQCQRISVIPAVSKPASSDQPTTTAPGIPGEQAPVQNDTADSDSAKTVSQDVGTPEKVPNGPSDQKADVPPPAHEVGTYHTSTPSGLPESAQPPPAPIAPAQPAPMAAESTPVPPSNQPIGVAPIPRAVVKTGDTDLLEKKLAKAEKALSDLTIQRDQQEIAYSRTISTLTAQMESVAGERDQANAKVTKMQELQNQIEAEASRNLDTAAQRLQNVKLEVDEFCQNQLTAMQNLRHKIREFVG